MPMIRAGWPMALANSLDAVFLRRRFVFTKVGVRVRIFSLVMPVVR